MPVTRRLFLKGLGAGAATAYAWNARLLPTLLGGRSAAAQDLPRLAPGLAAVAVEMIVTGAVHAIQQYFPQLAAAPAPS
jgi:hypothetical protein